MALALRPALAGVGRPRRVPARTVAAGCAVIAGAVIGVAVAAVNPLYVVLAAIAAVVIVAAFCRPVGRFWLLAGLVAVLPFAVIPVKFGVQLGMLDVLTAALLGVALLRFLARTQPGVRTPLDLPILVYIGLCCVSLVFGLSVTAVTGEDERYFLKEMAAVLLFFALTNGLTTRKMLRSFIDALVLGSFASALLAVALQLAGQGTALRLLSALGPLGYPTGGDVLRFIAGTDVWRATSTSIDPNIFGGLVMIGVILLVGRLLARPSRAALGLGIPMLAVMVAALLLSYSRGAWVALAAGLLFLFAIRYRRALPIVLVLLVVVMIALGHTEFGKHLTTGFQLEDQATAMRVGEYQDALRFISQYPVFGVGYGFYSQWRTGVHLPGEIYVGVSNIYLLMTLEIGLVGMAGFLAVFATLAGWSWKRYRKADRESQVWIATAAAALAAAAVAGIADHYFATYPHMVTLLWCIVAVLAVAVRLSGAESAQPTASSSTSR